jgi:hypothetical protein
VYETEEGRSVVAAIAPLVSLSRVGREELRPLGVEVDEKLRRVMASLETSKVDS